MKERCAALIEKVRKAQPVVHHITNYVTANDCANVTLAIGASPIMADALKEVVDMASMVSAVVLNMGTLQEGTIPSMIELGKAANAKGIPVIFDPVGVGCSQFRRDGAERLMKEVGISVLRGNISEIKCIAGLRTHTKGVDASTSDRADRATSGALARTLASRFRCVVAITGEVDTVSEGQQVICISNGHSLLSRLTGTGCMCSSLTGAFCGAKGGSLLEATVAALLCMGIAGELAFEQAGAQGLGSFRVALHDAISHMDAGRIIERAQLDEA